MSSAVRTGWLASSPLLRVKACLPLLLPVLMPQTLFLLPFCPTVGLLVSGKAAEFA